MTMHQHNHYRAADWHGDPHHEHAGNFRAHTRRPITAAIKDTDPDYPTPKPSPVTSDSPSPRATLNGLARGTSK
jgi:hypothetical protein